MLKTIITLAALATLATGTIAPAHAIIVMNGGDDDGGGFPNSISANGGIPNGIILNGEMPNGGGNNGVEDGSSTLTIQALELPPQPQ